MFLTERIWKESFVELLIDSSTSHSSLWFNYDYEWTGLPYIWDKYSE